MRWFFLVLALLVPVAAAAQEDDRSFLTRILEDNLSGDGRSVRLTGFEGALSSTARVASITLADDQGVWLALDDVELSWNRGALLSGRVEIDRLAARAITLSRWPAAPGNGLPKPEASDGFSLPVLPVGVNIGEISALQIRLEAPIMGEPVLATLAGRAALQGGSGFIKLDLRRLDLVGAAFVIEADYKAEARELAVLVNLSEPAGGIAARALGLPGEPAVDLSIIGAGPLDGFKADIKLATDARDRLRGQVTLDGAEGGVQRFAATLGGDLTPLLQPEYRAFFGPDSTLVVSGARSPDGALDLDRLRITAAQLGLDGALRLAADGLPHSFDLRVELGAADAPLMQLPLPGDPLRLRHARLRLGFDAAKAEAWELSGRVEGFESKEVGFQSLVLSGGGRIGRDGGTVSRAQGLVGVALDGLEFANAGLTSLSGPAPLARIGFDWLEGRPLRLDTISLRSLGLRLAGEANVTGPVTNPAVAGNLTLDLAQMDRLSALAGRNLAGSGHLEWQGSVAPLTGAFDGVLRVQGRDLAVDQPQADALLRGISDLSIDAARSSEGTHLRKLAVSAQDLVLTASGWLRSTGHDVLADFALGNLGTVQPGLSGAVALRAAVQGDGQGADRLVLTGLGRDLAFGQKALDGLFRGETRLEVEADHLNGAVTLRRVTAENPRLLLQGDGAYAADARRAQAVLTLRDLAALGGGFGGAAEAILRYDGSGGRDMVSLVADARDLSLGSAQLAPLLRGATKASARVTRENGAIRLEGLTLQNPQLDITGRGQDSGAGWDVTLAGKLANLGVLVPEIPGPVTLDARIDDQGARYGVTASAQGPSGMTGQMRGTLAPNFATADLVMTGALDAAIAGAFSGPNVTLRGPVALDLRLNGPLRLQSLSGQIRLTQGRLSLTNPPFVFDALTAQADLAGGRATVAARAQAQTGGALDVAGTVGLQAAFDADLTARVSALGLRDPELFDTSLNGALRVQGPLSGGAMVSGDIALGPTELRIPSTGLGGVAAFPDLTHRGESAAVRRTRGYAGLLAAERAARQPPARPYGLNIGVSAPNRVFVRGRGLDAELGGQFRLTGSTDAPVPSGGLDLVRGRLDLLGKRFVFTEGRIGLDGSLIPDLRLVATTQTDAGAASIVVEGPADAPVIRFESALGLPEEEVVARLLFGRGLETLTPFQAAQLAAAVASLTGRGGGFMDRLRQGLGLDDFDVGTNDSGATQLRAGRYISDNIYTDVTVDSGGKSQVSINLDLTPSVTVKGRASSDGSTGLGVFFERDY